jgi:hypothetical protein
MTLEVPNMADRPFFLVFAELLVASSGLGRECPAGTKNARELVVLLNYGTDNTISPPPGQVFPRTGFNSKARRT